MEWIKNNLPIISVYLITIGIIRLWSFYSYFGIDISSYLDLAEVIQLQFNYFALGFCLVIFANISTAIKFHFLLKPDKEDDDIYKDILKPSIKQRKNASNYMKLYMSSMLSSTVISSVIILVGVFLYLYFAKGYISFPTIEASICLALVCFLVKITDKYKRIFDSFGASEAVRFFALGGGIIVILTFIFTFQWARSEAFDLIVKRSENEVIINFEKNKITTTDSLVFIGKTKSYIFLFNRFTRQAEAFPFSDVKSIQYKPSKDYKSIPYRYRAIK